jgi:hypothetical protein
MNTPPPYFAARYGNRQRFPSPTAEAEAANTNANEPDQLARFSFVIVFGLLFL